MGWQAIIGPLLSAATQKGSPWTSGNAEPYSSRGNKPMSVLNLYGETPSPLLGRGRLSSNLMGSEQAPEYKFGSQEPSAYSSLESLVGGMGGKNRQPIEAEEYGMGGSGGGK